VLMDHPAPDLDLPIVSGEGAAQGDRVALRSLVGQVVVLDFWASWCGPCRQSIPALNEVHARYGDRVAMYGVNVENGMSRGAVEAAHRQFGAHFATLQDQGGQAQLAYRVQSIPTLVLIDRSGVVRWVETGVPDAGHLADRLDQLLTAGR
jgi:cytochrome c biogenesis protein CcmG, thiol:disulfide interchange protein DsbE